MTANSRRDAEMVDQPLLGAHHVADGDRREIGAPGLAAACRHARLRGPVVPMQPPSTLAQMTKKRSVSTGGRGRRRLSHQPGLPVSGWVSATYWSPVSAWQIRMALLRGGVQRAVGAIGDGQAAQRAAAIQRQPLREDDGLMRDLGEWLKLLHHGQIRRAGSRGNWPTTPSLWRAGEACLLRPSVTVSVIA